MKERTAQGVPVFLLLLLFRADDEMVLARPGRRITSYNVCYTKLLRVFMGMGEPLENLAEVSNFV